MEITGYDNDTLTTARPSEVIPKFLKALALKWPEMRVKVDDDRKLTSFYIDWNASPEIFPEEGSIFAARDKRMEEYSDENGAKLMESGEGSLLLIYKEKLPGIFTYDLVTPEDPEKDTFSAWGLRVLVEACSAT